MLIEKIDKDKRDIPIEDLLDYLSQIVISKIDENCSSIDRELTSKKTLFKKLRIENRDLISKSEEIIRQLSKIRRIYEIIENVDKIIVDEQIEGSTKKEIILLLDGIESKEPGDVLVIEEKIKLSMMKER